MNRTTFKDFKNIDRDTNDSVMESVYDGTPVNRNRRDQAATPQPYRPLASDIML